MSRTVRAVLLAVLLVAPLSARAQVDGITFGLTTTQEASGVAAAIQAALAEQFPQTRFSYAVAGTSSTLRSLEEGFLPFAVTHNAAAEEALAAKGGHTRYPVFANDFLLVGPANADFECSDGIAACLGTIASRRLSFLSRGDRSGTHLYELSRWTAAGIDPETLDGYRVATGGAANSLRICSVQGCFTIADEATYDGGGYARLVEIARDPASNVYALMTSVEAETGELAPVVEWLRDALPALSTGYGYRELSAD
ncbi:substrate-binding domain-containing protein [Salinarimonas ramus]|uniref:PBP domain-containing protein n=1 Tax=Salinarimonas ramus TaxID=690164 RepID=A0A917V2E5_9HYPH|nr:substrate-binding domain-containing protein [Salinarimonas ramus]GGK21218.1 hypothetical protein GCM10011322_04840 [Salinarimonas ramus]